MRGLFANPIVLLDEVEKLASDTRFSEYGPLCQLLGERTAPRFVDNQVDLSVDASSIIWIATANEARVLPDAIRSRFRSLAIAASDLAQAQSVVQSVYHELLDRDFSSDIAFAPDLAVEVAEIMIDFPPRQMRQVLLSAMGHVALNRPWDEILALRPDDLDPYRPAQARLVGFLSS